MNKKVLSAVAVGGLIVTGGLASTGLVLAQSNTASTLLSRVAQITGVNEDKLKDAFKQASTEKVDEELKNGKITSDEATKMKERIASGDFERFGGPHMKIAGKPLEGVAEYLGLSESDLMTQLRDGKKLVDIAKAKGKSESDLKEFLNKKMEERLATEVKDGKITQAQADKMKENRSDMINDLISGNFPKDKKFIMKQ